MKSTDILNRLLEEARAHERLLVSYHRLEDELWEAKRIANERKSLSAHQIEDIAALLLADNRLLLDKKIQWIKETRALTSCGLKEAKDAVEAVASRDAISQLRNKLVGEPTDPPF